MRSDAIVFFSPEIKFFLTMFMITELLMIYQLLFKSSMESFFLTLGLWMIAPCMLILIE
jgi:hypothetical protein